MPIIIFAILATVGLILYNFLCLLISLVIGIVGFVIGIVGFVIEWSIPALFVLAIIGVLIAIQGKSLDPSTGEALGQQREKDGEQEQRRQVE